MLLYFGALRVYLLDGGWSAWQAAKARSSAKTSPLPAGRFAVSQREQRRIHFGELRSRLSGTPMPQLVDTRTVPEFEGHQQSYMPRTGRLPGAVSLPFTKLFTSAGSFIPRDSYQAITRELPNNEFLVSYCEVGVRACIFALLHEAYTGEIVPVYDGSMMEWSLDATVAVERGRASEQKYC